VPSSTRGGGRLHTPGVICRSTASSSLRYLPPVGNFLPSTTFFRSGGGEYAKEAMGSDGGYHILCRLIQPRPSLHLLVRSSIRYDLSLPLSLSEDCLFSIFFNTSRCSDATISGTVTCCGQAENSSPVLDSVSNMTLFP
jgi:hypothetical protein